MPDCPLCSHIDLKPFHQDKQREYVRCVACHLVFVPRQYHLSKQTERLEYDKHQNNPSDLRYQSFLRRAFDPLRAQIEPHAKGLDFGCGSGPAICEMAKEDGILVVNYDPFYYHQPALLQKQYDFITMTEVIEHIAKPKTTLPLLNTMLLKGGILAVMTKRVIDQVAFAHWHYKNDPTHICFYSIETFEWIAQKMRWQLEIVDKDVVFFHKE